ncbi:MAG: acyl-CoA dehydrogenase family protein [Sphingobium sp.]
MTQATQSSAERPFARKGDPRTAPVRPDATTTPDAAKPLRPIVQSGRVDISDIEDLRGEELRLELVRRAGELVPLLAANAEATENNRRVVEANIEAIREAGLIKITTPRRHGGLETDMRTKLDVSRELARGCGSTAWVVTLLNVCAWFVTMGGKALQDDIWGDNPDARIAGVFAPSATSRWTEGGLIVSGKWAWASGCLHADWALVGVPMVDRDGQQVDQGFALIPMDELVIEDTWFVVGMKGTGSNTLIADDVFIPNRRIVSVPALIEGTAPSQSAGGTLERSSFIPVAALALVGPQLGLCAQAFDYVQGKALTRGISYSFYDRQADSPSFQLGLAEAASKVDAAHLFAYRAADVIDTAAREGRNLDYLERARIRMDVGCAITFAREAVDQLISIHGAGTFAAVSPLQRIWRDVETGGRHAVISPTISAEVYGRALVGIEGGVTALV